MRRHHLTAMLAFNLSACGLQTAATPTASAEAAVATRQAHPSQEARANRFIATDSGQTTGLSFASTWRASNAHGRLRFITELLVETYAVQRVRHFEFDSAGALQHYVEHTHSTLQRDIDRGATHIGTIEMEFAGGEAVYRARKTGGTPRSIRQWEVDRVLARAALLRRTASGVRRSVF